MSESIIGTHLLNKEWRMKTLYYISDKQARKVLFQRNHAQEHFNQNKHTRNIILKSRQLGFCLDPQTRVLTASLKWTQIAHLKPGTKIVAVDEQSGTRGVGRKMKTAEVEKVVFVKRLAYRITLDDGRELTCTGQHPWLTRKAGSDCKWRAIEERDDLQGKIKIGTHIRWITKPWSNERTYEDGWFGGMIDGEGSLGKRKQQGGISVSQIDGHVYRRMLKYVKNYNYRIEEDHRKAGDSSKLGDKVVYKICIGRMDEMFKLLGKTRPSKFNDRTNFWEGRQMPGKKTGIGWAKVIRIEKLGKQTMVDLQTSSGTYIAEGFVSHNTTYEAVDMFDDTLFTPNFSALLLSYDKESALDIFTNKIDFAWRNFPEELKVLYKVESERKNMLRFDFQDGTYSSVSVRTSGKSATHNRVHISEFASICLARPDRANEIMVGTIPAVPMEGRIDVESTARGAKGEFYDLFWEAWNQGGKDLRPTQYKSHFYNWTWDKVEIATVVKGDPALPRDFKAYQKDHNLTDIQITYYYYKWLALNRNWMRLKQEYPTTPEEAFESSLEGSYYFDYLTEMRSGGRIRSIPIERGLPVHTYWDIGMNDYTSILFFQIVRNEWRLIDYYENHGKGLDHYIKVMQDKGYIYGSHTAPHDIKVRELSTGTTRWEAARNLGVSFRVAPRLPVQDGIDAVRRKFNLLWVDKDRCAPWLKHMSNYRKEWNEKMGIFEDNPHKDETNHCFTGDTKVLTKNGLCPIMELSDSSLILTPKGWKKSKQLGITQKKANLVEITFTDGTKVKCTQEHLFLTENGWKYAKHLKKDMTIQSSLTLSRSIMMVSSIIYTQMKDTLAWVVKGCTEWFGKTLLVKYLKNAISTTKMTTQRIMPFVIWNAYQQENICQMNGTNHMQIPKSILLKKREIKLQNGMGQQKENSGIVGWQRKLKVTQNGKERRENVNFVKKNLMPLSESVGILKNTVIQSVKLPTIESVKKLNYKEDVYDINVPKEHCFSLSNGAVVHNCADATRVWAMMSGTQKLDEFPDDKKTRRRKKKLKKQSGYAFQMSRY